ncbi:hypothetical protein [Amycolatopsis sp. YIM 10]|uniref:hypothetical protein n=1 Tax=Amycolatopsis sp. YIM 10 TaxID=2653857 RepID=UPI0012904A66|nr:hypothetical protein [Amycolatopsis sp. YIM 10]QFU86480.1 hypothetical protein YIM_06315 [Amycolatopsis sp. YIM 10]
MQTDQYGRTILPENGAPKRRGRAWLIVLAVVVLGAAGVGIYFARAAQDPRPVGTDADLQQVMWSLDKNQPFLGTPAQDWAEGEAAIVLPESVATGGFSAKRVGTALGKVKEFLVASRLNRSVLTGGDLEPLLAPLAPSARDALNAELKSPATWPATYATKIAPGFRLLPAGPKVNGTVRAEPGAREGELLIRTNLVFAYAFDIDDPSQATTPLDVVASTRWDLDFVYRDDAESWYAEDLGLDLPSGQGHSYSIACGPSEQGLLAPGYSDRAAGAGPDPKRPPAYFDPASPMPTEDDC